MTILWPNGSTTPPNFSAEGHFGWRNSKAPGASKFHRGLDMWGIGTVCSIADGTVVAVGWGAGYGWGGGYQVWIQHDGFFSRSLHLVDGSDRVSVGDHVSAGQAIGTEGMTGAYAVHLHLEITPGQWHAGNYGQVDPKAWLYAHVGLTSGAGGGGASVDPRNDLSEEDDMRLIKNTDTGRIYAIAPEYITHLDGPDGEHRAWVDAGFPGYTPLASWSFKQILDAYGIPQDVIDSRGFVLNDLEGKGHEKYGSWSRAQKAERVAYEAKKAAA